MSAGRASALAVALDQLIDGDPARAAAVLEARYVEHPDPWFLGLSAFTRFMALDYAAAVALGDRALVAAGRDVLADPDAVLLARAARGIASAGLRTVAGGEPDSWASTAPGLTPSGDPLADAVTDLDALDRDTDTAHFVRYLVAEGLLACGRLNLAAEVVAGSGPVPVFLVDEHGDEHAFAVMLRVMRVRLYAFRGLLAEALQVLRDIPTVRRPAIMTLVVAGTETLVRGNAAERGEVRALADRLELARPRPVDYLSAGCYLLAAFGLSSVGDVRRSARLALFAGATSLDLLSIVDRGLTLELLVASAADEGDLDAAEAWRERADVLIDDPIASTSVARLIARVELLAGRPESALPWAERAIERARREGRVVEQLGGEQLLELARQALARQELAAPGWPVAIASESDARHADEDGRSDDVDPADAVRAKTGELRSSRHRLPPAPGSDWNGLSERERDIALMVAEGLTNREIGQELFLSEHTVRAHVSRVLAAFGAASRFAVAARVAELFPVVESSLPDLAELTPRQSAVAERIAHGLGNAEIGRDLELSVKTVEKHIGEIFRRWDVSSRVGIARIVRARAAA
ncbi:MAG: LuxR C-terminal-related transcriptional regulator [Pseudolysinimonas sp.]